MRILIVDDDTDQLKSLSLALRSNGFETHAIDRAALAIACLEEAHGRIDMVITDYSMPEMSGMDFLKVVKERFADMPVIMVSAMGRADLASRALDNGCDGFLNKPFRPETLIQTINRVMGSLTAAGDALEQP